MVKLATTEALLLQQQLPKSYSALFCFTMDKFNRAVYQGSRSTTHDQSNVEVQHYLLRTEERERMQIDSQYSGIGVIKFSTLHV